MAEYTATQRQQAMAILRKGNFQQNLSRFMKDPSYRNSVFAQIPGATAVYEKKKAAALEQNKVDRKNKFIKGLNTIKDAVSVVTGKPAKKTPLIKSVEGPRVTSPSLPTTTPRFDPGGEPTKPSPEAAAWTFKQIWKKPAGKAAIVGGSALVLYGVGKAFKLF